MDYVNWDDFNIICDEKPAPAPKSFYPIIRGGRNVTQFYVAYYWFDSGIYQLKVLDKRSNLIVVHEGFLVGELFDTLRRVALARPVLTEVLQGLVRQNIFETASK